MAKLRRDSGGPLDDDASLLLMARQVLGGPSDTGRSSYQVALTVCEECGRAWQKGSGEAIPIDATIVEMAHCDTQHIGRIGSTSSPGDVRPQGREHDLAEPVASTTHVGIAGRCSSEMPGNVPAATSSRLTRARQEVPPAVRRNVMRRDGGRCVVPGCRNAVFVDVHHLVLRSEGGEHSADQLVILCAAHHRAAHRGQLMIDERVSSGLRFRHADGSAYGNLIDPHHAEARAQAFRALRALGFREDQTRQALERVGREAATASSLDRGSQEYGGNVMWIKRRTEQILRAALGVLSMA